MAERVIGSSQFCLAPQWRGEWQWDQKECDTGNDVRIYNFSFSAGGQFSGAGQGALGSFVVSGGALDAVRGMLKWREKGSNRIVECAGHWDLQESALPTPARIDGVFWAFDVTALPRRLGQGRFTLTVAANAEGVPAAFDGETPRPVASDLV